MKKKLGQLIMAGAAGIAFLAAPSVADEVFAEENELNYTMSIVGKMDIPTSLLPVTKQTASEAKDAISDLRVDSAQQEVVDIAKEYEGVPYAFGGTSPEAFDYSGFTFYVYQQVGKEIPRTVAAQYAATKNVTQSEAQPGDLVFFNQTGRVDHVGIYLGDGEFISTQTNGGVQVASLETGYWSNHLVGFGRIQ